MRSHVGKMVCVWCCLAMLVGLSAEVARAGEKAPINPCLNCHADETPDAVRQWRAGKHAASGVKCYVCHYAEAGNSAGEKHNGFFVRTGPDAATCESCHPGNGETLLKKFSNNEMHP